jgi:hypothetical protein
MMRTHTTQQHSANNTPMMAPTMLPASAMASALQCRLLRAGLGDRVRAALLSAERRITPATPCERARATSSRCAS